MLRAITITVSAGMLVCSVLGCKGGSDIKSRTAAQSQQQDQAAQTGARELVQSYVTGLVETLPGDSVQPVRGQPSPLRVWRKKAAEEGRSLLATAQEREGSESAGVYQDGALLFAAIGDFWLGRALTGPAVKEEWEEGYERSLARAAAEDATETVEYHQHVARMKELGTLEIWKPVAEFEQMLPALLWLYDFWALGEGTYYDATFFSRTWQGFFEFPRTRDAEGPEQFGDYRDRLCKTKFSSECGAENYEHRDLVLRRALVEQLKGRVAAFREAHGEMGFEPVLARFDAILEQETAAVATIPEEYPLLADTVSWIGPSLRTGLVIGAKGVMLSTDDPACNVDNDVRPERCVGRAVPWEKELMGARDNWDLSASEAASLTETILTELQALADAGADVDHRQNFFFWFDQSVPASLYRHLMTVQKPADLRWISFVARRRGDGTKRLARVAGSFVPPPAPPEPEEGAANKESDEEEEELSRDITVKAPGRAWTCTPIASLNNSNVIPTLPVHYVLASGDEVVAGTDGKAEVTASLSGDLAPIRAWVVATDKPTVIGIDGNLSTGQMHRVLSAVTFRCQEDAALCDRDKGILIEKLLLGICN